MAKAKAQSLPGSCQEEGASVSPAGQPLLAASGSFPYPIALPECPWIDRSQTPGSGFRSVTREMVGAFGEVSEQEMAPEVCEVTSDT